MPLLLKWEALTLRARHFHRDFPGDGLNGDLGLFGWMASRMKRGWCHNEGRPVISYFIRSSRIRTANPGTSF